MIVNASKTTTPRKRMPMILSVLLLFMLMNAALGQEFALNDIGLEWKTIETEHFLVHYHQGTARTANLVAQIAEDIYPHINGLYQYEPDSKVEFVIKDVADYANGGAYFYDNKIEIFSENLDYILRGTHHWLLDVVTHEYAHIISIQKALKFSRRVPAGWFQFFGYEEERRPDVVRGFPNVLVSYPISGITIPVWFAEGVAQFQSPTRRYDYRDSNREMILRDRVMTGNLLDLTSMSTFGKNSIGNESSYNQGFSFVKYLAEQYGDTVVSRMAQFAGSPLRIDFNAAIKKATGVDAHELHDRWHQQLKERYTSQLASVMANLQTGEAFVERGIGNMYPRLSRDGKKVALVETGDRPYFSQNKLVVHHLDSGKKKTIASEVTRNATWSPDGRYVVFAKITPNRKLRLFNDLYVYDLETEKEYRLTKNLRARHPDWSHDGKKIAFIIESDGITNLATIELDDLEKTLADKKWTTRYYDLHNHQLVTPEATAADGNKIALSTFRKTEFLGKSIRQLTQLNDGRQIYHPRWAPGDAYLIFDTSHGFGRDIAKISPAGDAISYVLSEKYDERFPAFHPASGNLVYASDETGIFNIYSLNLQSGEKKALTNVVGGAFMPDISAEGDLFYSLYKEVGFRIYRLQNSTALGGEKLAYIDNYQEKIPDLTPPALPEKFLEPRNYKNRFSKVSFMPRLLVDYATVKPGFYVYNNEVLNKLSFFGGGDINLDKDYSLFGIFEYRELSPTIFLEIFNQSANIQDTLTITGRAVRPELDVTFNLLQSNLGIRGILPIPLKFLGIPYLNYRLEYIYSWYRAKLGLVSFTDPADGQLVVFSPVRYSYLRGHAASLLLQHENIPRDIDSEINPRGGRYFTLKYVREWNKFLDDFATDRVVGLEIFDNYNFGRFEANWEEYLKVPGTRHHSLTVRLQGGFIDAPVDSFFHFFGGGLVGLKGYPFYSLEGRRLALGSVTYRFPLLRNINKQIFNIYFDKLYLGGFYQYGNAWSDNKFDIDDFVSNAGVQLRLDTFSWYFFPTRVFFEAAYPLNEHMNQSVVYPKEWKFYFGFLFDFDLRLEQRPFRR